MRLSDASTCSSVQFNEEVDVWEYDDVEEEKIEMLETRMAQVEKEQKRQSCELRDIKKRVLEVEENEIKITI